MSGTISNLPATTLTVAPALPSWEKLLRRYVTQATIALSLVAGVSGVMLFFHLGVPYVKSLHEWLGMGFALVAALHALRHRQVIANMLRQPRMQALFTIAALASVAFVVMTPANNANPFRQATQAMTHASLRDLAPVLGTTPAELTARLRSAGVAAADTTLSIDTIARTQGANPTDLLAAALRK